MKIFKKLMTFVALAGVCFVYASELDNDFEQIAADTNVIVETSEKATRGIDWQVEVTNQSSDRAYVTIIQDGRFVLSGKNEPVVSREESPYFALPRGSVVRVAGLDPEKEAEIRVLSIAEYFDLFNQDRPFAQKPEAIAQRQQETKRLRKGLLDKNTTAYMVIDKAFTLEPVKKSIFRRITDSGLPLDKNIKE